jgi:L-asparaginase
LFLEITNTFLNKYKRVDKKTSILIIYTGGTIGMVVDPESGSLVPLHFEHIAKQVPEINKFDFNLKTITLDKVVDSSDITPETWVSVAKLIEGNYEQYDGLATF